MFISVVLAHHTFTPDELMRYIEHRCLSNRKIWQRILKLPNVPYICIRGQKLTLHSVALCYCILDALVLFKRKIPKAIKGSSREKSAHPWVSNVERVLFAMRE